MRYYEFKQKQQKEFDKLPMKAAFGDKQFEEMMSEWGLTTSDEDLKKIISLGYGAYCKKEDAHLFHEYTERAEKEKEEFFKDDAQLKDAFIYEFGNHECGYTYTPTDALEAFEWSWSDIQKDERLHRIFKEAWDEFIDKCE